MLFPAIRILGIVPVQAKTGHYFKTADGWVKFCPRGTTGGALATRQEGLGTFFADALQFG